MIAIIEGSLRRINLRNRELRILPEVIKIIPKILLSRSQNILLSKGMEKQEAFII